MPVKSISELRSELSAKEEKLGKLQSKHAKLTRQLEALDRQIRVLSGAARRGRPRKAKRGWKRRKVAAKKVARRGRPRKKVVKRKRAARKRATGKPLAAYMKEVLARAKGGMRITKLVKAVSTAGYKSHSKDFYAIVAKTLLQDKGFKRVKRGVYKLA